MLNGVLCMRTVLARMHSMLATVLLRARSMHNTLALVCILSYYAYSSSITLASIILLLE